MASYFYIDVTETVRSKILENFRGILVDFEDFERSLKDGIYENETVNTMQEFVVYYPSDILGTRRKYCQMFLRADKKPKKFEYMMKDGTFRDPIKNTKHTPEEFYGSDEELSKVHEVFKVGSLSENIAELSASRQRDARKLINLTKKYLPAIDQSDISGGIAILNDGKVRLSSHICYGFMQRQDHFTDNKVKHYIVSLKRRGKYIYYSESDEARRGHELMYNYVIKESPFKRVLKDGDIPFKKAIESGIAIDTEFSFMDVYVAAMFLRNAGEDKKRSVLFRRLVEEYGISTKAASILIQYFYLYEERVSFSPLGVHGICCHNSLETGINFLDKHKPKKKRETSLRGGFTGVFDFTAQYPVRNSKHVRDWFGESFGGNGWNFESPTLVTFVTKLKETYGDLLV